MSEDSWTVGVDVGATHIKIARVDSDGQISHPHQWPTPDSADAVIGKVAECVRELIEKQDSPAVGVGVGVAGQVSPDGDRVLFAPNLDWKQVPLGSELSRLLSIPVTVLNDVQASTWGERMHGEGRGCDDLACVFVGTGVGGAIISGGRMLHGHSCSASEIGHMVVRFGGPKCRCGNRGCLEAFAGGWAIAKHARQAVRHDAAAGVMLMKWAENELSAIDAKLVGEAARADDPLASEIIDQAVEALIAGMVSVVNVFNPCRLILGGGIIQGLPEIVGRIESAVRQRALPATAESLQVVASKLQKDAGVIGAASYALESLRDESLHESERHA